ncbi:MAG: selenocysteine-specific translation elongation factor [Gemmataceae bacterium]|nr:selenocysteine-specific translation elongation factor [Gemmataceae bacterium]MCI0739918.1 selenocysteine-specific translation elongation factor [Gemmataceae bacterium]
MPRELILGTAGHIDHGKTSLVKALTGTDCDRLPEEKARGITIDIGFATLDLGEFRLGVVDVPGHERFIKNMLAGATGIDVVVLVVAADDSVMPQTREHLEILKLLGLRHGLIALTKCDLVDDTTREVAELEIRELVQGSFLENAPIIATSAQTRKGLDELKVAIADICKKVERHMAQDWFRLPIDRSFIVQGHGTVVTGSVISGSVHVGDELNWQPRGEKVRVRSLQNHDQAVEEVHRGMRAAINLAGVHHEDVIRGQEVCTPGFLKPSRVVTVRLHCLRDQKKPLKHRASVRFHLGTAEIMGTVSLLDCDAVTPGAWGIAQVFLDEPATAVWGQPFVVRGPSATTTLGGGQILQPVAKKIRRRHLEILERIEKLWTGDAQARALAVAWFGGFTGFDHADLVRGANLAPAEAQQTIQQLSKAGKLILVSQRLLHVDLVGELEERVFGVLKKMHMEAPLLTAHDRQKVQAQLDYIGEPSLVHVIVERLLQRRKLVGDLRKLALAEFKPKLSANLEKLKDKVVSAYRDTRFQPPDSTSFASQAGGNAANLKDLFDVLSAEGFLVHVVDNLYLHADAEADMRRRVQERLQSGQGATVAEIRDLLGTTRKFAVPLCEYLDRIGVTKREGDLRVLAKIASNVAT